MKPLVDDRETMNKEIKNLEKTIIILNNSLILFIKNYDKQNEILNELTIMLGATKLEYATNWGEEKDWKLDRHGIIK